MVEIKKCPPHYDPELEYDRNQFEKPLTGREKQRILSPYVEHSEASRMQIVETCAPRKNAPEWATSEWGIRQRIFGDPVLIRRYRMACLYWLSGWSANDVAKEFDCSKHTVEELIRRLSRSTPTP